MTKANEQPDYVHGYSSREAQRLLDQAGTLTELLHHDSCFPAGSRVLEAGCGVGAQTVVLTAQNPSVNFTCIDISEESQKTAGDRLRKLGRTNAAFQQASIFNLPFGKDYFDHVFVCFVLEHLADPVKGLSCLMSVLKPGGTLTVIEGDHGSAFYHPPSCEAQKAIQSLVEIQAEEGGDALIGRRLYALLAGAGLSEIAVSPRTVFADAGRPEMVEGFTLNTFTAMVEGVEKTVLARGLMDESDWRQGIRGLRRTAEEGGSFCYTFFKAIGRKKG